MELTQKDIEKIDENECAICKDVFLESAKIKKMPCKHFFYNKCLITWLKEVYLILNYITISCKNSIILVQYVDLNYKRMMKIMNREKNDKIKYYNIISIKRVN